jgi:hypothetical protein
MRNYTNFSVLVSYVSAERESHPEGLAVTERSRTSKLRPVDKSEIPLFEPVSMNIRILSIPEADHPLKSVLFA